MQRSLILVLVWTMLGVAASTVRAASTPATCPGDVSANVRQACPCGSFKNHGQFMKCVQKQTLALRKGGCAVAELAKQTRCWAASICGKPHNLVVCCNKRGHAKLLSTDKCTSKGGTVLANTTTLCDAACPTSLP